MSIPGIPEESNLKLMKLLKNIPESPEIILFGSRAKGTFREGSDIDIALKSKSLTLKNRDQLLEEYHQLYLPWKLDLVIYHLVKEPALIDHIDQIGKKINPNI